jgi:hypothetical protein
VSRPTRGPPLRRPIRGCHPLRPDFPDGSGNAMEATGLVRFRSPLLTESRLMSFPPATEMFQFAGFASHSYVFTMGYPYGWVAPFGDPGINDRSHLPRAYRSVPRPSSPLSAKASTRCPYSTRLRIAVIANGGSAKPATHRDKPQPGTNPMSRASREDTLYL